MPSRFFFATWSVAALLPLVYLLLAFPDELLLALASVFCAIHLWIICRYCDSRCDELEPQAWLGTGAVVAGIVVVLSTLMATDLLAFSIGALGVGQACIIFGASLTRKLPGISIRGSQQLRWMATAIYAAVFVHAATSAADWTSSKTRAPLVGVVIVSSLLLSSLPIVRHNFFSSRQSLTAVSKSRLRYSIHFAVLLFSLTVGCVLLRLHFESAVISTRFAGTTPDWREGIPQGFVDAGDHRFLFSNHFSDRFAKIYLLDSELTVLSSYRCPDDLRHPSGMAISTEYLIVCDYLINQIVFFDLQSLLNAGRLVEAFRVDSTLLGTSACEYFVAGDGTEHLIVSDYRNSGQSYVLNLQQLIESRDFTKSVQSSYNNGGMSQGVAYYQGRIFDASNSLLGLSAICIYRFRPDQSPTLEQRILIPVIGIQDLTIIDGTLYSTDEISGRFVEIALKSK